jgi:hypothetical protein
MKVNFEFQHVRSGENIIDGLGNVVFNSGGDFLFGHRYGIDAKYIEFLDGERINQNIFTLNFKIEPIRELWFDVVLKLISERNVTKEVSKNSIFAFLRMMFNL